MALESAEACLKHDDILTPPIVGIDPNVVQTLQSLPDSSIHNIEDAYLYFSEHFHLIEVIADQYKLTDTSYPDNRYDLIIAENPAFNLIPKQTRRKISNRAKEILGKTGSGIQNAYGLGPDGLNNDDPNMTAFQRTMKDCATLFGGMALTMDGILVDLSTPKDSGMEHIPYELLEILAGIALMMHGHLTRRNPSKLEIPHEQLGLMISGATIATGRMLQNPHDKYTLTASALMAIASAVYAYKLHKAAEKDIKG